MNKLQQIYLSSFLTAALLLSGFVSKAQTTIFLEKMGTVTGTTTVAAHETANGFDNDALTMTTDGAAAGNSGDLRKTNNIGTDGADDANVWLATAGDRFFAIEGVDASGYTNLSLEFYYRKEKATSLADLEVAFWDGTAYVPVAFTFAEAATALVGWYAVTGISLPAAAQINNLKLRFKKPSTSAEIRLDQVKLTGTSAAVAPTIASTLNARANVFTTVEENFSVTNTAGSNANQLVKVKMTLGTPVQAADFALLYETTPGNFLPLTFNAAGEMEFGPATGFPLANATTNFKITFSAAGTYNYDLAIVDATTGVALAPATSESVTVAAFVNPTIASTLNNRANVVTNVQEAYSVTTVAGNMAGRMVKVKATLATPAQAADMTLEYLETSNATWYPLPFDANGVLMFGPATGFPLANATSDFRVTYTAAGTYTTTLEIVDATTGLAIVPGTTESVTVTAPAPVVNPTIASTLNARANVLTTVEETFSVTTTAGSNANQLVKVKMTLGTPAQASDITLSYEATPGNFLPLTFNAAGEMEFGPATGFPLANATTNFKITFSAAGTYNYSLAIVDATTGVALAPATAESVTVTAPAPVVNPTIASTLHNRTNVKATIEETFDVTATAGTFTGQIVKIKMTLGTPAQAADITLSYEATPGNFLPLTFDANGVLLFGPATGFPLADATTNFKVTFATAGTYNYSLAIIDATTNADLATPTAESVTVAPFVNPTIASTLNGLATAVERKENSFAVTTTAGDELNRSVKIKIALANPAQSANITLTYEATPGVFLPLTFDASGESVFGPATGFPLANATTNFKIIFDAAGTYAYTLSILDANTNAVLGTPASESVTILVNGVKEEMLARAISVYPNPATANLNVNLGAISKAEISVMDLTGKVVAVMNQVSGEAKINVANLKAGTYLLRVKTAEGVATKRFVVVR